VFHLIGSHEKTATAGRKIISHFAHDLLYIACQSFVAFGEKQVDQL
jgi:hypothetical protein